MPISLAELRSIARQKAVGRQASRAYMDRCSHSIRRENAAASAPDGAISASDVPALRTGETLGDEPTDASREHRHVVMQVLLEERVVRRNARSCRSRPGKPRPA